MNYEVEFFFRGGFKQVVKPNHLEAARVVESLKADPTTRRIVMRRASFTARELINVWTRDSMGWLKLYA